MFDIDLSIGYVSSTYQGKCTISSLILHCYVEQGLSKCPDGMLEYDLPFRYEQLITYDDENGSIDLRQIESEIESKLL